MRVRDPQGASSDPAASSGPADPALALWFTLLFAGLTLGGILFGVRFRVLAPVYLPAVIAAWLCGSGGFWLVGIQLTSWRWNLLEPLRVQLEKVATGDFAPIEPPAQLLAHPQVRTLAEGIRRLTEQLRGFHALGVDQLIIEKAELEAVIHSMTEGLIIYDLDLKPVLVNPALRQIAQPAVHNTAFLEEPDNLFRDRWVDPARISLIEQSMHDAPERPRTDLVELKNPRQFFKRYSAPLFNKEHTQIGHLVIFHDVTTELEADEMKSEFISNASHELRTPVTSMKVLVENVQNMLEDVHNQAEVLRLNQFPDDFEELDRGISEVKAFMNDVLAEADRMHQLVNDLLDVAKLDSASAELNLQSFDAARVIEEAVATIYPQARQKEIELRLRMPGELQLVADRVRLRQILVNILGNAVKYTQDRGQVTLAATNLGTSWEFAVTDNGIGIPTKDLPHIFDRFFRVGRDRARSLGAGGSGLGLSIARSAVQAHGGQIHAESTMGQGTTFRFTIPLAIESTVPSVRHATS